MFLSYFLNRGAEQSETWYLIIVPLRRGSRNLSTAQVSVGASRCPCIFPKARVRKHNYFHRTLERCVCIQELGVPRRPLRSPRMALRIRSVH